MPSPAISAIIIAKNEAADLPECLEGLRFCREVVVVVDNTGTDSTAQIAQDFGARVMTTPDWPGFGPQKQRALDAATGDWVLSIDADERITPELAREIQQAIASDKADGYYIKRRSQFLGKWMNHGGWYPDQVLRLARRGKARFDPAPVHEKMLVDGTVAELGHPMLHYSYRSLEDVLAKQKTYALAGAAKKVAQGLAAGQSKNQGSGQGVHGGITGEHSNQPGSSVGVLRALLSSMWTFTRLFFFQLGFLDGWHGLVAALAKSQETFWKYLAVAWPGDRSRDR